MPHLSESNMISFALFSSEKPDWGCAILRISNPLGSWNKIRLDWGTRLISNKISVNPDLINNADGILIQRFFPSSGSWKYIEKFLSSQKPIIYDIDDLLIDIPTSNPFFHDSLNARPYILEMICRATAVTVSTDELRRALLIYNPNIFVLPNLLNDADWVCPPQVDNEGPIVIGYAGTNSHMHDLEMIEPALENISRKYKNTVAFTFIGCRTPRLVRLPGTHFVDFDYSYPSYLQILRRSQIQISIAPLEDTAFNRCKSNIKWLEYSAAGFAGVYSNLPPYSSCVEQNYTGVLVGSDYRDWQTALEHFIEDREFRLSISAQARKAVLSKFTLNNRSEMWIQTFLTILGKEHIRNENTVERTMIFKSSQPESHGETIDIVIPVYGQAKLLSVCIKAILVTTERAHIILVDDRSPGDEIAALFNEWKNEPRITLAQTPTNMGFIGATRFGADPGSSEFILFLNSDTEAIEPGWLDKLIPTSSDVAVTGALLIYPPDMGNLLSNTIQHAGVARDGASVPYHPHMGQPIHTWVDQKQPIDVNAVTGACFLVRRKIWEELGGWDARFGRGVYEDVDFCWQVRARGLRVVFQPAACLYHRESASSDPDGSHRLNVHQKENLERLLTKWNYPSSDEEIFFGKAKVQSWNRSHQELQKARGLLQANRQQEAILVLKKAVEISPDLPEALVQYAEVLSKTGNHLESADILARAVHYAPGDWTARLHWIDELLASGDAGSAYDQFEEILPMFPHHPEIKRRDELFKNLGEKNPTRTASALLDRILASDDILETLEASKPVFTQELLDLILENRDAAIQAQDHNLGEGLQDLADFVQTELTRSKTR